MDRLFLLAPALMLLATFAIGFVIYCTRCATGRAPSPVAVKHNELLGPFMARFLVWMLGPIERLLVGRVAPNTVTAASLALCALTGLAAGLGHLPGAVWLYAFAGMLDVLDGRLARHVGRPTTTGALFDSVSDRWGELSVFAGYAWLLHDSVWLLAVMAAVSGSMMVSYTRARAESLGLAMSSGIMQRAERVVVVTAGTLIAALYGDDDAVAPIVGVTMTICGVASIATALHRWRIAHRELARRAAPERTLVALPPATPDAPATLALPKSERDRRAVELH